MSGEGTLSTPRWPRKPFALNTGDPEFNPEQPLTVNGFLYAPDRSRCDLCGGSPVRTELDGENLCQTCADAWVRGARPEPVEDDDMGGSIDG